MVFMAPVYYPIHGLSNRVDTGQRGRGVFFKRHRSAKVAAAKTTRVRSVTNAAAPVTIDNPKGIRQLNRPANMLIRGETPCLTATYSLGQSYFGNLRLMYIPTTAMKTEYITGVTNSSKVSVIPGFKPMVRNRLPITEQGSRIVKLTAILAR